MAKLERTAEYTINHLLFSSARAKVNERRAKQAVEPMEAFQKRALLALKTEQGRPLSLQALLGPFSAALRETVDVVSRHNPDFLCDDPARRALLVRELVRRAIVTW